MKLYSIKDWNKRYENNRTRELVKIDWVPIPNKQDGEGYTLIMEQKEGPAILGAWLAILQIASKCEIRGTLMRDTAIPHDSGSISRQSRFPKALIERALLFLSSQAVGWIEVVEIEDVRTKPHEGAGFPHEGDYEGKGIEGNEGKGIEASRPKSPLAKLHDLDFISTLKASPAYKGVDVDRELAKMDLWLQTPKGKRRKRTAQFILNWMNRADRVLDSGPVKTELTPDQASSVKRFRRMISGEEDLLPSAIKAYLDSCPKAFQSLTPAEQSQIKSLMQKS